VRAVGRRTKKLIVAFHFHLFSNQAGWKCDECRKAGLDVKRRCGWLRPVDTAGQRVVWARKQAATNTCPKSYITVQSIAWLEEFVVRRKLGQSWPENLGAREAEAFLILESEWEAETQNG
jgi:hypothetical protein